MTDAPARVVSEATLLDNAKGSLEKTPDGKVEPACFIGNTTVHTYGDYGYAQSHIEDLWVGDLVLSRCEKTGELAYRPIVDFFEHDDRETWTVTHRNGGGLEETLWTTAEHPFWIQGLGWTPVSQLKPGQLLEISNPFMTGGNIDGVDRTMEQALASIGRATSTVVSVQRQEWRTKVYNFEVEGFHTYFVGDLGAWVHNKSVNSPHSTVLERSSPDAVPHGNPAQVPTVGDAGTIAGRIGENNAAKAVAEAGREVVQLADKNNFLGKPNELRTPSGQPKIGKPDFLIDGRTADAYTPQGSSTNSAGNPYSIRNAIEDKTLYQSSDIVLNLSDVKVTPLDVLDAIRAKPIPTLGRLYVLEPNGKLTLHEFPITDFNKPIFGTWDPVTNKTSQPLPTQPVSGIKPQEVFAQGPGLNITPITLADIDALLPAARQYWLDLGARASVLSNVQIDIGQLPSAIAGQAQGKRITLSQDGAGWGWFVDATPSAAEEFDVDSAAQNLRAKAGSAAAGKLDLLTVLIHELGHVLNQIGVRSFIVVFS